MKKEVITHYYDFDKKKAFCENSENPEVVNLYSGDTKKVSCPECRIEMANQDLI